VKGIHPLISQFVSSIIAVMIISVTSVLLTSSFLGQPFDFIQKNVMLTAGFNFRVNLFLNTINAVYFFNKKYREKELETEKLKSSTISARYEVLNNQINPHFLFNNLNTLSTLIRTDTKKADLFLQKLSDIYRYLLKTNEDELVRLKDELNFLNDYIELLQIRFGDAIKINMSIDEGLHETMVPPTVLQLLVENVVKHNYFTEKQPVNVTIENSGNTILVANTLQKKEAIETSFGIGLKNISERYRFFDKDIDVQDKDESFFKVAIPVILVQHEHSHT
jgi:LytS/YehU family sensor histidine kinase